MCVTHNVKRRRAFFRLEQTDNFARAWVFAGYTHQMKRIGGVRPVEVGGLPLFPLRADDGNVSAYHNVCQHRNTKLIDSDGNTGRQIRCPYHL